MEKQKITEQHFHSIWESLSQHLAQIQDLNDGESYYGARRDFRRFLSLYFNTEVTPRQSRKPKERFMEELTD